MRDWANPISFLLRGLLMGVLFFFLSGSALGATLVVSIVPESPREYIIEVRDSLGLPQRLITEKHRATFNVQEGFVTITIEDKKTLKKYIVRDSIIQILYD